MPAKCQKEPTYLHYISITFYIQYDICVYIYTVCICVSIYTYIYIYINYTIFYTYAYRIHEILSKESQALVAFVASLEAELKQDSKDQSEAAWSKGSMIW